MNPRAVKVEALDDYTLIASFDNGETKKFNATHILRYPVYSELNEISFFKKATVNNGIVVWNSSIDLDPDLLYLESVSVENKVES